MICSQDEPHHLLYRKYSCLSLGAVLVSWSTPLQCLGPHKRHCFSIQWRPGQLSNPNFALDIGSQANISPTDRFQYATRPWNLRPRKSLTKVMIMHNSKPDLYRLPSMSKMMGPRVKKIASGPRTGHGDNLQSYASSTKLFGLAHHGVCFDKLS